MTNPFRRRAEASLLIEGEAWPEGRPVARGDRHV